MSEVKTGKTEYRCALCRELFEKAWSDEEAMAEKERDFGDTPAEACVVVCDDCYQNVRPDTHPDKLEAWKAARN